MKTILGIFNLLITAVVCGDAFAVQPSAHLRAVLNDAGDEVHVYRSAADSPVVTQIAKADFRPYLHPIVAPDGKGVLTLVPNGTTYFTQYFAREPAVGMEIAEETGAERLHPGLVLINQSDCRSCHNEQLQTVGPYYQAIADKYPNTPVRVKTLARKVRAGGAGVWGSAAMTAHPDLTPENAEQMVAYILSLDSDGGMVVTPGRMF